MLRQSSLCFLNTLSLLKHCKQLLQNHFLFYIFCLMKHKSVKMFDVYIMRFITINDMLKIYQPFKFWIWNKNWKNQSIFVTKHVNANVAFSLNLAKIFFLYRKLNSIIIKIFSQVFITFSNSFWIYFYRIIMPNMTPQKHFWSLFLILNSTFLRLLSPFLGLIQQVISHKNFVIMVDKLKC